MERKEKNMVSKTERKRSKNDLMDVLFCEDTAGFVLVNEKGQELAFRQVYATIKDGTVYCILVPAEKIYSLPHDGALPFVLSKEQTLTVVQDRQLAGQIFAEYYRKVKREGE